MPCYSPENVNAQRGEGAEASIAALQLLNSSATASADLPLHLSFYNPVGPFCLVAT
jgi:hypothetical protein